MKTVYIAHPISGDVEGNLKDISRIIRAIANTFPKVVPMVPYYAYVSALRDHEEDERVKGMMWNAHVLKTGNVQELWLTGTHKSPGMIEELRIAKLQGIKIVNLINQI
ncbi:MAG: hypothetical protein KGO82_16580 [Bacteroidota bacterium]|nr:hypothetical protein [Bacteroidota bacterium]